MKKVLKEKVDRAIALKKSKIKSSVNIMALDQATHCGVAIESSKAEGVVLRTWDLTKKTKESDGIKWLRFESKIVEAIKKYDIKVICYELPGGQHTGAKLHSAKLIAIIERAAALHEIDYIELSSKTIKKFATDNGNASKQMMIESAEKTLGYVCDNDNEADALWMLFYVKSQLNT